MSASTAQAADPLIKVRGLKKHFPITKGILSRTHGYLRAVDGVSFDLLRGETLGLVGESGCGKTTTGRSILRLIEPTDGHVEFDGQDILGLKSAEMRSLRRRMQIIFKDPYTSLNPRMRVSQALGNPLKLHEIVPDNAIEERVIELLELVGLQADHRHRYPHEFSGGQRQRISIARAMALEPDLIIADEAVSALDVSVRAQILNLFRRLQQTQNLTYLFIAHDLSVVEHFCDRVGVMHRGKIVEEESVENLFNNPSHPYTQALISAIPWLTQ